MDTLGGVQTVNARDLHTFLGVGKDFSSWMKVQVERARLVENWDFIIFAEKGEYRKPLVEYHLTIEAGKHIGMMSGTDKGVVKHDAGNRGKGNYEGEFSMAQELSIFNYEGLTVRTIEKDGEPWFMAKDVADVFGLCRYC